MSSVPIMGKGTLDCCFQFVPFSTVPSGSERLDWLIRFFMPSSENMPPAAAAGPAWRSESSSFWGTLMSVS